MSCDPVLRPCPFCGGSAYFKDDGLRAECSNCGVRTAKMANAFTGPQAVWDSRINESPQGSPEQQQDKSAGAGPASGSPVSELVGRLEKESYWSRASSECSDFTAGEQEHYALLGALLREAATSLRALEAERDALVTDARLQKEWNADQVKSLQREADQLREWLRRLIAAWQDPKANWISADELSEIRSKMEKAGG